MCVLIFTSSPDRYKESFSKGTRGFKDKLLARNSSVKELSKGVQREMGAGIAGVARMMERFDLSSKRTGPTVSKEIHVGSTAHSGETTEDRKSGVFVPNSGVIPGQVEVSCVQVHYLLFISFLLTKLIQISSTTTFYLSFLLIFPFKYIILFR